MHGQTDSPLVSYVVATYNRRDDLREAVQSLVRQTYPHREIVVISNATDGTEEMFADGGEFDEEFVRFFHFEGRMGVPQARNVGYRRARGDIVVTIDDDAVLQDSGATGKIVDRFDAYPEAGALAFQSRNYHTDDLVRMEVPDSPVYRQRSPTEPYWASFFVGVGNAIRAEVFEEAGYYPDDFVYGFEEMDLSLRILDAGYKIRYTPSIVVEHKKSPEGRSPGHETLQRGLENRLRIMVRNLPWRYVAFSALVWSAVTLVRAGFHPGSVTGALATIVATRHALLAERDVIGPRTIEYIKSIGGMFFWLYGPHPLRLVESGVGLNRLTW